MAGGRELGTGSIKGIIAVIFGQLCLYGIGVKGTHFKKPLKTNEGQKTSTFYLAFTS